MRSAWHHVIGFVLLFISTTIVAQETEITFEFQDEPVIEYGAYDEWDGRHTSAGAVVYHDGQYHMFRNGYRAWLLPLSVGYATSSDGIVWQEVQEDPVFRQEQIPFDVDTALLTSAIVEPDETWTFYFVLFHRTAPEMPAGIVRATAETPTSDWVVDSEFVLNPGDIGAWDSNSIGVSSVIRNDDGYMMHYTGNNGDIYSFGLATSDDGINWTKFDDPTTTSELFAESDPVFTKNMSADWEIIIQDPRVVQTPSGFVMLYNSVNPSFRSQGFNLATSEDGVVWERVQALPIIPRTAFRRSLWLSAMVYHNDQYSIYLEVDSRSGTDIFVGQYRGVLGE